MAVDIERVTWRRGDTPQHLGGQMGWHQAAKGTTGQVWQVQSTGLGAWDTLVAADITALSRDIPFWVAFDGTTTGVPLIPDEDNTQRYTINFAVPTNWDGATDITAKALVQSSGTGLADIETGVFYYTEADENAIQIVSALGDNNLTWTTADRAKMLTFTITPAAGRYYRISLRKNTGDANAGSLLLVGVSVRTKTL